MALRFWASSACFPLPSGRILVFISVTGGVDPRALMRLEGLDQLKNTITSPHLSTCSIVPQPIELRYVLKIYEKCTKTNFKITDIRIKCILPEGQVGSQEVTNRGSKNKRHETRETLCRHVSVALRVERSCFCYSYVKAILTLHKYFGEIWRPRESDSKEYCTEKCGVVLSGRISLAVRRDVQPSASMRKNRSSERSTKQSKNKLRGLRPRANYTDRATASCRRSYCQPLRIEGVSWSVQRIPTAVISAF
jgi:hypothetical protein